MSVKQSILKLLESNPASCYCVIKLFNKLQVKNNTLKVSNLHFRRNKIRLLGSGNILDCGEGSFLQGCSVHISGLNNRVTVANNTEVYGENRSIYIGGNNNRIIIGSNCNLRRVNFFIGGNNNTVIIEDGCTAYNVEYHIEQNGNTIHVGKDTTMHGRDSHAIHMAVDEGTKIIISEDCMFAHSVQMRTTDSHSIVDANGVRTNPAKDIFIGKHVWLCQQSMILKGSCIPENTVVAAGSVCSKDYRESNCILAGNPARIVKQDVNWDRKYL